MLSDDDNINECQTLEKMDNTNRTDIINYLNGKIEEISEPVKTTFENGILRAFKIFKNSEIKG